MSLSRPIVITPGDPAGVGPDVLLTLAQEDLPMPIVAMANKKILMERASQLNLPIQCIDYDEKNAPLHRPNYLPIINEECNFICKPGIGNLQSAKYIIDTLTKATQGCLEHRFAALVTGPINKKLINQAGISFSGHTEFLKTLTGAKRAVMLFVTKSMKVALLTTHIPLKQVPDEITEINLMECIQIISNDLRLRFGIKRPCIGVCGLNPHAGEGGYIGDEEEKIMIPVLNQLKKEGLNIKGPLSADTAFTPNINNDVDVILAMYHDQGLPVLKYAGFGQTINVTLGLPIIRTSVDHGTAYDIAATGKADPGSLKQAILLAHQLYQQQCNTSNIKT